MHSFYNRQIYPVYSFREKIELPRPSPCPPPPPPAPSCLIKFTLLTLVQATLLLQGESPTCILNEDTHPVIRAIGVSHTACKDEFRQNLRSHSWSVFLFS